jgi:CheY-like chemotaxis protein
VKDTGIGLKKDALEKIFDKFSQADTSITRKFGGTGLGLSISQNLVQLMDGKIEVFSEYQKGSEFVITLPLERCSKAVEDYKPLAKKVLLHSLDDVESSAYEEMLQAMNTEYVLARSAKDITDIDSGVVLFVECESTLEVPLYLKSYPTLCVEMTTSKLANENFDWKVYKPARLRSLHNNLEKILSGQTSRKEAAKSVTNHNFDIDILLVEDNKINQKLANKMLSKLGCNVVIAEDGVEALKLIDSVKFDLVFMDCQMPNMDGFQCTKEIRSSGLYNTLPIVAMTANAMRGDREKCLSAGMTDYVSKPINKNIIVEMLQKYC